MTSVFGGASARSFFCRLFDASRGVISPNSTDDLAGRISRVGRQRMPDSRPMESPMIPVSTSRESPLRVRRSRYFSFLLSIVSSYVPGTNCDAMENSRK